MDLLHQNWRWIAENPWGFAALAILFFGLGWGAANLLYRERIELLKARADSSDASKKSGAKIQYRLNGRHGPNVLATTTHEAKVEQRLSFQADVPEGQRLHVVLHGPPAAQPTASGAGWYFNVVGVVNWVASTYQEGTSSPVQHFNAEAGPADMQFYFGRAGDVRIEVFEDDSTSPTWSKSIRVLPGEAA